MTRLLRPGIVISAGVLGCSLFATNALPAGLQVAPVSLTIDGLADTLWLTNTASTTMHAQVRVYHWTQDGEQDHEDSTNAILASPPIVRIAPAAKQAIRVVRATNSTTGAPCEEAYRLKIDEILDPLAEGARKSGIRYRLSYSVPIFILRPACAKEEPQLTWKLDRAGSVIRLVVHNGGMRHARLSGLSTMSSSDTKTEINPGLVGYVLPGSTMAFPLGEGSEATATAAAAAKTIEVMVNGSKVVTPLPPAAPGQ